MWSERDDVPKINPSSIKRMATILAAKSLELHPSCKIDCGQREFISVAMNLQVFIANTSPSLHKTILLTIQLYSILNIQMDKGEVDYAARFPYF